MRLFRIFAVILFLVLLADIGCIMRLQQAMAKTQAFIQNMEIEFGK